MSRRLQNPGDSADFFAKWEFALWKATQFGHEMTGEPLGRKGMRAFQRQCHRGFDHAQKLLVALLLQVRSDVQLKPSERRYREQLIRKVADSIAIALCNGPSGVYHWCTQNSPVFADIDDLRLALQYASKMNDAERLRFHLLADLTSCIHTCDILRIDFNSGSRQLISPMEMKTGKRNAELFKVMSDGIRGLDCSYRIVKTHTTKELDQIIRMNKQLSRAYQSTRMFTKDFRSTFQRFNSYPLYFQSTFGDQLETLLDRAKECGAAAAIVDGCMIVVVGYSQQEGEAKKLAMGKLDEIKNGLLPGLTLYHFAPFEDNLKSMVCMPFTLWQVSLTNRLQFARKNADIRCALIHEPFLKLLNLHVSRFDLASRKQTAALAASGKTTTWLWNHRAIRYDGDKVLTDEYLRPMSTDLIYPAAVVRNVLHSIENECSEVNGSVNEPALQVNFEYF